MTRAYSISGADVDAERARVDQDLDQVDISRVIMLDELELRDTGPRDVRMKILAVSAEHNLAHAALADTVHISELRGGKIYPGNSALGEVIEIGSEVTEGSDRVNTSPGRRASSIVLLTMPLWSGVRPVTSV